MKDRKENTSNSKRKKLGFKEKEETSGNRKREFALKIQKKPLEREKENGLKEENTSWTGNLF